MKKNRIAYEDSCLIKRIVIDKGSVQYGFDGEIISYKTYDNKDVIDMEVIDIYDSYPGEDLKQDVKKAIIVALKAIEKHGNDHIELLINKEDDELYVHYHSKHDSVSIYCFENYDTNNTTIIDFIKEEFEKAEIDICEY